MKHVARYMLFALAIMVLAFSFMVTSPEQGAGQIRASEKATISQTLDGTTLALEYYRPVAKGRDLFGGIVPWGVVWTPGANWATTLEVSKDLSINGVDVPAGTYSVWAIPREDRFTITLNDNPEIFHFHKPDSTDAQIHISAEPVELAHVEMLTWSFPNVRGDAAILQMQWGTTAVPLQVEVQPSQPVAMTPDERALYVGNYDLHMTPGLGWPDSGTFEVFEEDGMLKGRMPFGIHPGLDDLVFDLVPAGTDLFNPRLYRGGEAFGIEMGVNIEFELGMENARSVRWYGPMGTPFGEGGRLVTTAGH
jgi:hypothetical protein